MHTEHHSANHQPPDEHFKVAAVLSISLIISLILGFIMANASEWLLRDKDRKANLMAEHLQKNIEDMPEPRLQEKPALELLAHRLYEKDLLENPAWVNQAQGKVRIPIEEAMDLLIKQGLPYREETEEPK